MLFRAANRSPGAQPSPRPGGGGGFTLVEIAVIVVIIGLLAVIAIPYFLRATRLSQDKAVLNNARQLAAAADLQFLETGGNFAAISQLVGATLHVKNLRSVAAESYPEYYTQGITITVNGVAGGRTITYAP
jgi:type II secretory pathway pseudopilin PulG